MVNISEQIKQLQDEAKAQAAKIEELMNQKISKLTAGAEKDLLATLTTAAECYAALPDSRKLELWKEEKFDGVLTSLKLQPIKTKKPTGRGKGNARPGRKIKEAVKAGKTSFAEIAAEKGLSESEVKTYVESKPKEFTVKGDKVSLVK